MLFVLFLTTSSEKPLIATKHDNMERSRIISKLLFCKLLSSLKNKTFESYEAIQLYKSCFTV